MLPSVNTTLHSVRIMPNISTKIISVYQAQLQDYKRYRVPEEYVLKFLKLQKIVNGIT